MLPFTTEEHRLQAVAAGWRQDVIGVFQDRLVGARQRHAARCQLAGVYQQIGQIGPAIELIEDSIHEANTPDQRADSLLCRRCLAENVGAFQAAAFFYQLGLENNPTLSWTRSWFLNNLCYSLNQLGRHEEAERVCRQAIEPAPTRIWG